jgi:NADPH:quinone reductase-like Zn-dependent oxidoreductase
MGSLPTSTNALVLREATPEAKSVYHDVVVASRPIPSLKQGEILVKMTAAAFNRRDLWIRLGQYPGITFDSVLGSDGVGL